MSICCLMSPCCYRWPNPTVQLMVTALSLRRRIPRRVICSCVALSDGRPQEARQLLFIDNDKSLPNEINKNKLARQVVGVDYVVIELKLLPSLECIRLANIDDKRPVQSTDRQTVC